MNKRKLGTIGSVLGVVLATAFGWVATSSTPAANPLHLVDLMGGDAPQFIYWINGRLDSDYTGELFNVRRSAGAPATTDIGFIEETNLYDSATLATFCAGVDCFVVTVYDQSGSGLNATQGTTTRQPKVWDSATGAVTCTTASGTELCMLQDNDDRLDTANHGFVGAPAITVAITVDDDRATTDADNATVASIGAGAAGSFNLWAGGAADHYAFVNTTTSSRWYRLSGMGGLYSHIMSIPASGTRSTVTLKTNGVVNDQPSATTGDDVTTLAMLAAGSSRWGRVASNSIAGRLSFFAAWDEQLSGARATALDTWLTSHTATTDRALVVAGQSNAGGLGRERFVGVNASTLPSNFGSFASIFLSGTCLSDWEEGDSLNTALRAHINAQPSDRKVVIWWLQGECDASSLGSTYEASFRAIWDDLVLDTGRTLYLIDTLLHDDLLTVAGRADTELVNTAKIDNCADLGASICAYLDPDDYGLPADTTDGVHHNTDLQDALHADMLPLAQAF